MLAPIAEALRALQGEEAWNPIRSSGSVLAWLGGVGGPPVNGFFQRERGDFRSWHPGRVDQAVGEPVRDRLARWGPGHRDSGGEAPQSFHHIGELGELRLT